MRICFIVGLSIPAERKEEEFKDIQLSTSSARIVPSFFTMHDLSTLYAALLKLRYSSLNIDWTQNATLSRIIAAEMLRGRDYLIKENNLDTYLYSMGSKVAMTKDIPVLNLLVGNYGDEEMEANLDINSRNITNSQIIIAGATGSGKTNLLAVLMQQFRALSSESQYPVNFLLFDYKENLAISKTIIGSLTLMWIAVAYLTPSSIRFHSLRSKTLQGDLSTKSISIRLKWHQLSVPLTEFRQVPI